MFLKNIYRIALLSFVFCINGSENEIEPGSINQDYQRLDDRQPGEAENIEPVYEEGQPDSYLSEINSSIRVYNFSKRIWLYKLRRIVTPTDWLAAILVNPTIQQKDTFFEEKIKCKFDELLRDNTKPEMLIFDGLLAIRDQNNNNRHSIVFISEYPSCLNNLTGEQNRFIQNLNVIDDELVRHYYTEKTDNIRYDDFQSLLNNTFSRKNIYFKDIMSQCQMSRRDVSEMINSFTQEQREIIINAYMIQQKDSGCCCFIS